jgi:hypothetical protein
VQLGIEYRGNITNPHITIDDTMLKQYIPWY